VSETTTKVVLDQATWRTHAGDWIAVQRGELVAAAETYYRILSLLAQVGISDPEDCDYVAWVPVDDRVKFERWRERVSAAQREFGRRLRG
jgi:hypothetical protein